MSEQHTPPAGGNGAPPPASGGTPDPSQPGSWEAFRDSIRQLGSDLGSKFDGLTQTVRSGEEAAAAARQAEAEEARRVAEAAKAPPDFEAMTNGQLVEHIVNTVTSSMTAAIAEAMKPINSSITQVQTNVAQSEGQRAVVAMQQDHKDFNDWRPEMVELARAHPTLDLPSIYKLARANNPTKAAELDGKYNPPPPPAKPAWGGLVGALSGDGSPNPSPPKLSTGDATREAYKEVAEKYPGVLPALLNMT